MTKKLTTSHIAVAVAASLTAQTALSQTPIFPPPANSAGQEVTPMIKLDNSQYSGQGFFEKSASTKKSSNPIVKTDSNSSKSVIANSSPTAAPVSVASKMPVRDPMMPLNIAGSKDAQENTKGGLAPSLVKTAGTPASAPGLSADLSAGLKKQEAVRTPVVAYSVVPSTVPGTDTAAMPKSVPSLSSSATSVKKKAPARKKSNATKKTATGAPLNTATSKTVPVEVEVKEIQKSPTVTDSVLYAAAATTPIVVTEVVRVDSIALQAPTMVEQETQPLPRIPEPIVAAAPLAASEAPVSAGATPPTSPPAIPAVRQVDVPVVSASMDDLPSLDAPSVDTIRKNSRLNPQPSRTAQHPIVAPAPFATVSKPPKAFKSTDALARIPATPPVSTAIAAIPMAMSKVQQEYRDAKIHALLDELKTLQSNPIAVQSVQAPIESIALHYTAVPTSNPAATVQLPLPPEPRPLIKLAPKESPRMAVERAPKAPVDATQTAIIDAPRPTATAPVLDPRAHRVANPKFAGLPEKGDFIAFMPGSSHVSEETVASLRSMVDVFKQHGIRKIMLTGTSLRDEDTEDMESSDFAQKRAKNLKAAFQRAGFKGVVALDDPKRARPGTTPRVGLVALQ